MILYGAQQRRQTHTVEHVRIGSRMRTECLKSNRSYETRHTRDTYLERFRSFHVPMHNVSVRPFLVDAFECSEMRPPLTNMSQLLDIAFQLPKIMESKNKNIHSKCHDINKTTS